MDDLREPALSFGEHVLDVGDLVLVGQLSGTWPAFAAATSAGLALEAAGAEPPPAAEVKAAATRFRYERGLLSAADFVAWLRQARLANGDLAGVLRRRLLRERHPAPDAAVDIAPVRRAELVCTGTMGALVREATDRLAAARGLGDDAPGADPARVRALAEALPELAAGAERAVALEAALEAFAPRVATADAVRRRLADHRLDWLRVRGEEVAFAAEGAAREARLLVAEGTPLADVARLVDATPAPREALIDAAPPGMGGALASAAAGELVGPWEQDGTWRVLVVADKVPPRAEDARLRARAARELLDDALGRLGAGQARRHVPV
jgi:hypothetical protein